MSNKSRALTTLQKLLQLGYKNGHKDATGVLSLAPAGDWALNKVSGGPNNLFQDELVNRLRTVKVALGHNRFTTQGAANINDNNHPFQIGEFSLIHNGTLYPNDKATEVYDEYIKEHQDYANVETDSFKFFCVVMAHFDNIIDDSLTREERIVEAVRMALKQHGGVFSIFLTDMATNLMYYFKCDTKKFFFRGAVNGNVWRLIGSTTLDNLPKVLKSAKTLGVFQQIIAGNSFEFVPEGLRIYRINPGAETLDMTIKDIGELEFDDTVGKESTVTYGGYGANDSDCNWDYTKAAMSEDAFDSTFFKTSKVLKQFNMQWSDLNWDANDTFYIDTYNMDSNTLNAFINALTSDETVVEEHYNGCLVYVTLKDADIALAYDKYGDYYEDNDDLFAKMMDGDWKGDYEEW